MTYVPLRFFLILLILPALQTAAQEPPGGFGGFFGIEPPKEESVNAEQLYRVNNVLQKNIQALMGKGVLSEQRPLADTVRFGWPLRQAAGFNDPGYYGISNYLDQDPTSNGLLDFNCGKRTYNGHRGTDIYTYPFGWAKKDENAVEVIAAADGIIVAKFDNYADTSCANCNPNLPTCQWNAVFVRSNTDGTIVWYGHLKKASLTTKAVGEPVAKGEYLGVVGSSGNSTGPHLHFEVWLNGNYDWLIDPWQGTCNSDGNSSFWETQEPYHVPMINKVATASAIPKFSQCYNNGTGEQPNYKNVFGINETVYFPVYVRDNLVGKKYHFKIVKPSGEVMWNWSLDAFNTYYSSAWLYYYYAGSYFNVPGTWKFIVSYENNTVEHLFSMAYPLPLNLLSFTGEWRGKSGYLAWKTTGEEKMEKFLVERSTDGRQFGSIGTIAAKGKNAGTTLTEYDYYDELSQNGSYYYRLKMMETDGNFTYSKIVSLQPQTKKETLQLLANPVGAELRFVSADDIPQAAVRVIDQLGKTVMVQNLSVRKNQQTLIAAGHLAPGMYYLMIQGKSTKLTRAFLKQ